MNSISAAPLFLLVLFPLAGCGHAVEDLARRAADHASDQYGRPDTPGDAARLHVERFGEQLGYSLCALMRSLEDPSLWSPGPSFAWPSPGGGRVVGALISGPNPADGLQVGDGFVVAVQHEGTAATVSGGWTVVLEPAGRVRVLGRFSHERDGVRTETSSLQLVVHRSSGGRALVLAGDMQLTGAVPEPVSGELFFVNSNEGTAVLSVDAEAEIFVVNVGMCVQGP